MARLHPILRYQAGGAVIRQANSGVHLNAKTRWIKDGSQALLTHWIVSASVEWLLGINVAQYFIVVDRMAVDGVVVVEPPVHGAPMLWKPMKTI